MMNRFENLWDSAAGDGALTPIGVARPECEFDDLMKAWTRERQDCIEYRLYLDEAGRLLREILAEDQVPQRLRRRVRNLLMAVRAVHASERRSAIDED